MKKVISLLIVVGLIFGGCAVGNRKRGNATSSIVLYYSQTGSTKAVAEELQRRLGANIEALEVENPYNGTYAETIQRCQEERNNGELPTLKAIRSDLSLYDTIYLGYPIWFGTFAPPIIAFLEQYNLEGKTIIPFCTFGSGGLNTTTRELVERLPKTTILEGYGVRAARLNAMPAELDRFLKGKGIIPGGVKEITPFSEHKAVSESERVIFDKACGNYQFPLGVPITVASRPIENGTEYQFTVATDANSEATSTIYVVVGNGIEDLPEFTQVIR